MQDNCPRHECLNPCQNKFELSLHQGAAYLLGDWHELGLSNIQSKKKKATTTTVIVTRTTIKMLRGNSLVVQRIRLCTPSAGGLGSIPGQETRSHMSQLKIPRTASKTWHSHINKYLKKKRSCGRLAVCLIKDTARQPFRGKQSSS